jgi:SNF2 family DNA or RNA helicase
MHGRQIQIVNGFKNLGELSNKLKDFSYRVLKEDCLDLPEKIFIKRQIQLSPEQRRLYDQMKKECYFKRQTIYYRKYVNTAYATTANYLWSFYS